MIKFKPLNEDAEYQQAAQLEEDAMLEVASLDLYLPEPLLAQLLTKIEEYDWGEEAQKQHYESYEAFCDDYIEEMRLENLGD